MANFSERNRFWKHVFAIAIAPASIIFISTNLVNLGNLAFNLIFVRLMAPAVFSDLALILTLKLSILSVLNAFQMLATERVSTASKLQKHALRARYEWLSFRYMIVASVLVVPLVFLLSRPEITARFGLSSSHLLPIFALALPSFLPLILARGVAQGCLDMWRVVLSAQTEMGIRLGLGVVLYFAFGIDGVIIAFVLSLWTAWAFARPAHVEAKRMASWQYALPWQRAMPWAALQLAIVLMLDGEVIIAKMFWSAEDAGVVAALSLIQRLIFFASFALTSVMIPQIILENRQGRSGSDKLTLIIALFAAATVPTIAVLFLAPELVTKLLFGTAYASVTPSLFKSGLIAAFATATYFVISYAIARKFFVMAYGFLIASLVQISILSMVMREDQNIDVFAFVDTKLLLQILFCVASLIAIYVLVKRKD